MSRIFFISIKPKVNNLSSLTIDRVYGMLGSNTGNLLFTNAVWDQIKYDKAESGFEFDPEYVNVNFDHVVIPAANWLYENFDFLDLALLVEKLTIPVVMIGIGAQAGLGKKVPILPEGTLRFLKAVSERSKIIGARGSFSAEVLDFYGIKNVATIGCPSLFLGKDGCTDISKMELNRIMAGGTRYAFSNHDESTLGKAQRSIYRFAFKEKVDINYQSERPEFDYIISNGNIATNENLLKKACDYYGSEDVPKLLDYISNHGHVFTNVDEWFASMREYDFYIGSRIHGVIAALLSGTPACLLTHDSRTKELADFASIPSFSQDEIGELSMARVETIFDEIEFYEFQKAVSKARINYIDFLNLNSLPHNLASTPDDVEGSA